MQTMQFLLKRDEIIRFLMKKLDGVEAIIDDKNGNFLVDIDLTKINKTVIDSCEIFESKKKDGMCPNYIIAPTIYKDQKTMQIVLQKK